MNKTFLKQIMFAALTIIVPAIAVAQEIDDTIVGKELHEVVVSAPRVIHKADMDVLYPSKSALDNSQNGMQLIRNLMIPTLYVNEIMGSVTASGQAVQVRINGREATFEQVKNLLPESIKRVEWIDNPGLRYNGANYVLNFIVSNPAAGGSLMIAAKPALTAKFGTYNADLKLNFGKSQWTVGGYYKLTDGIKAHRDYHETFTYPDGKSLTRVEKPIGGSCDDNRANGWITYNYTKPDTTVFYASFEGFRNISALEKYSGILSLSDGSNEIHLNDGNGSQGTTPTVSAYLEQHFANRQTLVVDFGASSYKGNTFSDYMERRYDTGDYISDIHTYIKDSNKAFAIEANYIKKWSRSRFTAGASYTANRNRSTYENLGGSVFHQRQDKAYIFAEYFRRLNKFSLTAGLGVQYNDFLFRETNQGSSSWNFRPQATVTYSLNSKHHFRIGFTSWQTSPSLAESNIAPQQIDGFQWQIGNPDLKTSNYYALNFRYSFSLPRVDGVFAIRGCTSPDAIAPDIYWDGGRLVTSYENSRGYQSLTFNLSPQLDIIPGWFMASVSVVYRAERSRGTGYEHYNHNWSGNAGIMLMHWGFVLSCQYNKAERYLFGQRIKWNEDFSIVDLSYNWKKWQFGAGILMPFGKYDQGSKLLSHYNSNVKHMRVDLRIPYLSISYNLEWGRQKRAASKIINADASVETSKTGSR